MTADGNLTGRDVAELALALVGQTAEDSEELIALSLPLLRAALTEALPTENSLREAEGDTILTKAPWPAALDDEIDYHQTLLRTALPYSLASSFLQSDDNDQRAMVFYNRYVAALSEARRLIPGEVEDVYAETD